jgi:hypothetical protein
MRKHTHLLSRRQLLPSPQPLHQLSQAPHFRARLPSHTLHRPRHLLLLPLQLAHHGPGSSSQRAQLQQQPVLLRSLRCSTGGALLQLRKQLACTLLPIMWWDISLIYMLSTLR